MKKFICLAVLFFIPFMALAQEAQGEEGDVVEVGEAIIKIEVEKPQVQIIGKRIQPEFQDVNLEKSFLNEILDKGQQIKFDYVFSDQTNRIDIDKLLNRQR
ncbi:MAG: hypothetical protein D6677_11145 [Calditrichaeota bacterium]|nr:MAG: hypothetical protein D6677_11145 [Calditrichota bacterium]